MSDLARQERAARQHWAEPGSRHDKVVKVMKFVLPVLILLLVAVLAIAPFDKTGDVSFILDKNKVETAPERMRVEAAKYSGVDDHGRSFQVTANRAIQQTSNVPIVSINGMNAELTLDNGVLDIAANSGLYDLDNKMVDIVGSVNVTGPDGYSLVTRDVRVDLDSRTMQSKGPVSGTMELGEFEAGSLSADLDQRTVTLDGGVRLKIRQGAFR